MFLREFRDMLQETAGDEVVLIFDWFTEQCAEGNCRVAYDFEDTPRFVTIGDHIQLETMGEKERVWGNALNDDIVQVTGFDLDGDILFKPLVAGDGDYEEWVYAQKGTPKYRSWRVIE